jgi:hypothetical protein
MGPERHEIGEPKRRFGITGFDRIEKQLRAVLGHLRGSVADDEPFAELGHRLDIAALGRGRQLVDCFAVSTRSIVLRGNGHSTRHQ